MNDNRAPAVATSPLSDLRGSGVNPQKGQSNLSYTNKGYKGYVICKSVRSVTVRASATKTVTVLSGIQSMLRPSSQTHTAAPSRGHYIEYLRMCKTHAFFYQTKWLLSNVLPIMNHESKLFRHLPGGLL